MLTREQKLEAKRTGIEWARVRRLDSPNDNGIFDSRWVYCGDIAEDDRGDFAVLVAVSASHAWKRDAAESPSDGA